MYISLINQAIEYIEENIGEQITLSNIARQFCLSEYHFTRLFKAVVGTSLKQYILGRKLSRALEKLNASDASVIDIAYDFGFEYPEVFSRAFKKQFGISPNIYRRERCSLEKVEKASVVTRELVNFQGSLALKGDYVYLEAMILEGVFVEVDTNSPEFEPVLKTAAEVVINQSKNMEHLQHDKFYSVVHCHGEDNGEYTVFSGKERIRDGGINALPSREIPGGWYVGFSYRGDMFDIRSTFIDDLYRWIAVKEIELGSNGVGMISVFDKDYNRNGEVRIFVPIKMPDSASSMKGS
ncbi:MAG: AraC family transcriptional regulator [Clostridia bacterium]|nr:AraC family transcriptional regulator [Clostridia bacterium]